MSAEEDDESERQRRAQQWVSEEVKREITRAEPIYSHAMNALWAGNGTASLAVLAAISTTAKNGAIDKRMLLPLFFFLSGLICMCVGTLRTLIHASGVVRRKERASSMLDFLWGDIRSPSEEAGLTFDHPRTRWGTFAGACFVLGCVIGFLLLLCS